MPYQQPVVRCLCEMSWKTCWSEDVGCVLLSFGWHGKLYISRHENTYLIDVANGDWWKEDLSEGSCHSVNRGDNSGVVELWGLFENEATGDNHRRNYHDLQKICSFVTILQTRWHLESIWNNFNISFQRPNGSQTAQFLLGLRSYRVTRGLLPGNSCGWRSGAYQVR